MHFFLYYCQHKECGRNKHERGAICNLRKTRFSRFANVSLSFEATACLALSATFNTCSTFERSTISNVKLPDRSLIERTKAGAVASGNRDLVFPLWTPFFCSPYRFFSFFYSLINGFSSIHPSDRILPNYPTCIYEFLNICTPLKDLIITFEMTRNHRMQMCTKRYCKWI